MTNTSTETEIISTVEHMPRMHVVLILLPYTGWIRYRGFTNVGQQNMHTSTE